MIDDREENAPPSEPALSGRGAEAARGFREAQAVGSNPTARTNPFADQPLLAMEMSMRRGKSFNHTTPTA